MPDAFSVETTTSATVLAIVSLHPHGVPTSVATLTTRCAVRDGAKSRSRSECSCLFSAFGPYLAEAESAGARLRVRARPTWLIAGEIVGLIRKRSGQGLDRPACRAG